MRPPAHYVRRDGRRRGPRRRRAAGTATSRRTESAGAIPQAMGPDGQAPPRPWRAGEGESGDREGGRPQNEQARREQDLKCGILNSWAPGSSGRSVLVLSSRTTFELGSRAPEEIRTGSLSAETTAAAPPSRNREIDTDKVQRVPCAPVPLFGCFIRLRTSTEIWKEILTKNSAIRREIHKEETAVDDFRQSFANLQKYAGQQLQRIFEIPPIK